MSNSLRAASMKKIPTDLEILQAIFDRYHDHYVSIQQDGITKNKIYISVDLVQIAAGLAMDPALLFGRLYYHLANKYNYEKDDGGKVYFFGNDPLHHGVNFPYVASVLADLRDQASRQRTTWILSILAILIATFAAGISLAKS